MTLTLLQWVTLVVFAVTIIAIVINKLDATVAALLGVAVMVWMGTMTEVEAAQLVDWNVMAILIGIWIIAGYFGRTGVPSWLSVQSLKLSGGRPGLLIVVLSMLTGILSMFIDNVVCILMMAPVALPLARALSIPATPLVLMIGFSANFMGTALLLGDLPPQMLHSVAGAEFFDFIWQHGRPSSFPILMVTFIITLPFMYFYGFRSIGKVSPEGAASIKADIPDPLFAVHHRRHVPSDGAGDGVPRGVRREARLHRADRRDHPGADPRDPRRQAEGSAELRAHRAGARLARGVLLHRAVRAGRRSREDPHPRHDGERDEAAVRAPTTRSAPRCSTG